MVPTFSGMQSDNTAYLVALWGDLGRRTKAVVNLLSKALGTVTKCAAIVSLNAFTLSSSAAAQQYGSTAPSNTEILKASRLPFKARQQETHALYWASVTSQTSGLIQMGASTG